VIAPFLVGLALAGLTAGLVRLWHRFALTRVAYDRWFEKNYAFPGEPVRLSIQFANQKPLPVMPLHIQEQVPVELVVEQRRRTFFRVGKDTISLQVVLGPYQTVVRHYNVIPQRRGFHRLGPAQLTAGDPFGFRERHQEAGISPGLAVYPQVRPLTALGLDARRPLGELAAPQTLLADPFRVAGTRPYQPGDPLNRIHWGATARTGDLQVRVTEPTTGIALALFVNGWSFPHFWEGTEPLSFERGCSLAASVAAWAAEQGIPVGLWANGVAVEWGAPLVVPLVRGADGLGRILEGLARLQGGAPLSLVDLMAGVIPTLPAGTAVAVITRLVSEELLALLAEVRRSRAVILFVTGEVPTAEALDGINVIGIGEEAWHEALGA
jgi:uncharacterized protein (DUF58 family)